MVHRPFLLAKQRALRRPSRQVLTEVLRSVHASVKYLETIKALVSRLANVIALWSVFCVLSFGILSFRSRKLVENICME